MTYCLALKMNEGMVFASDSRTNAGVDQIASFKKMRTYNNGKDRVIVTLTSGNLSITQSVVNLIEQRANDPDVPNIWNAKTLFDVATLFGECLREVRNESAAYLEQSGINMGVNFIVGGQLAGEPQRLFLIYSAGNFIEATDETPFFQIGETKYGKPVLDRFMQPETPLVNAVKCALVSLDSTIRSNISVGLPIDLVSLKRDHFEFNNQYHITEEDAYFSLISSSWREGLTALFDSLPAPEGFDTLPEASLKQPPAGSAATQSENHRFQPSAPSVVTADDTSIAQHQPPPANHLVHAAQNSQPVQNAQGDTIPVKQLQQSRIGK